MKTDVFTRNAFLAFAVMGFVFGSCSSNDDVSASSEEKDAVDAITYSLESDSNGLAKQIGAASQYAADEAIYSRTAQLECGQEYSASYNESFDGANYDFDYFVSRTTMLSCTGEGNPESLSYHASYEGSYDTPRMASDDSATSDWTISGLDASASNANFDGSYTRNGSQVSKVRNQNAFTSNLNYSLDNILVSKSTHQIVSGSATVAFYGQSTSGNTWSYNGEVVFNGNGTATLTINGNTYTINL